MKVGVYGAGVIGLTTALALRQQYADVQVTVIASDFGEATTSDGAAGLYLPGSSFSVGCDKITRLVLQESFDYYTELLHRYPSQSTGISEISGYIFSNTSKKDTRNSLVDGILPMYRNAREDEIGDWKYGSYLQSVITECRWFLPWIEQEFRKREGIILKNKISDLSDLTNNDFDLVINCLGLGASEIFNDRTMVPLRGQVLKVKAPWLKHFYLGDHDTYIIPGRNNVTLGGTRNYDNFNLSACPHDTASIWERCTNMIPRLNASKVERIWVGLRPHRDPVRIELENIYTNGRQLKIIHNYGHGGSGVTTAPGSAKRALRLFEESQRRSSKL